MNVIKEQKAEIERLTKDKSFATRKMIESKAKAVELQKQVDELTAKKNLSIANIEKELTHYLFMSCSYGALVCGKMSLSIAEEQAKRFAPFVYGFVQQVVKEFAEKLKEIWEYEDASCCTQIYKIDELLKEYEKCGVEKKE